MLMALKKTPIPTSQKRPKMTPPNHGMSSFALGFSKDATMSVVKSDIAPHHNRLNKKSPFEPFQSPAGGTVIVNSPLSSRSKRMVVPAGAMTGASGSISSSHSSS